MVNYIGPLVLFQATLPLLKASKFPKFIPISSRGASSTGALLALGTSCYASVKAALNSLAQAIHFEYEWLGEHSVQFFFFAEPL
jgi:NAD(P)-dependent dehydrogenase (short-subunit alcohol dehydrogenase family)